MSTHGFVGLGIMGRPMALNLIRHGHALRVYARRAESLQPLIEAGATAAADCAELARYCDVIFIMVADSPDVEQVISGPRGLLEGLRPGSVLVDMSTIAPQVARQLAAQVAERGGSLLDAPVSGGEQGAREGSLSVMVGGDTAAFQCALPLLKCLGKNIVHVGGAGAGQTAKACNQLLVAQTISAVAEAFIFAKAGGVDAEKVREALLGGFAYSRILEVHGARMLRGDYQPGFKLRLHRKDLRIVMDTARELDLSLPGAAQAAQYLNRMVGAGHGELDSSAIAKLLENMNGVRLADG